MCRRTRLPLDGRVSLARRTRLSPADGRVRLNPLNNSIRRTRLSSLDGRVRPDTGVEQGLELPVADAARLVERMLRPFRQRTTDYREPAPDRRVAR